jgi:uncharacterized protein (TIGR03067 family)
MKGRLIVALIAVAGLTAFAPAPLPRPQRRGGAEGVSLPQVQGQWRVVAFDEITGPGNQKRNVIWFRGVRIKGDELAYTNPDGKDAHPPFRIVINNSRKPAHMDWFQGNAKDPVFIGLVRRQGNRFTILYYSAGQQRPTSFENIPTGWWLLELER